MPGCAIRGKSQANTPRATLDVFACDFPLIVPAANGGAQPGAFMELHALHGANPEALAQCVKRFAEQVPRAAEVTFLGAQVSDGQANHDLSVQ